MISDRLTVAFCILTLVTAAAYVMLHFSPGWIGVPAIAAVVSSMRQPVRSLVEMVFGGRQ